MAENDYKFKYLLNLSGAFMYSNVFSASMTGNFALIFIQIRFNPNKLKIPYLLIDNAILWSVNG